MARDVLLVGLLLADRGIVHALQVSSLFERELASLIDREVGHRVTTTCHRSGLPITNVLELWIFLHSQEILCLWSLLYAIRGS